MNSMEPEPGSNPGSGLTADAHEAVRGRHRDERTEDYVEALYRLERQGEKTRVVDLQSVFGVSHVTVIRALEKLEADGWLRRSEKGIELTKRGHELARHCYERHEMVEEFLVRLGVSREVAAQDAEGIEHHLSDESLAAMQAYIEEPEA